MGIQEGANSFSRSILGAMTARMQEDGYNTRAKAGAEREETRFNRMMELQRGKDRMDPSYKEAMKKLHGDPQNIYDLTLPSQIYGTPAEAMIPSAGNVDQPSQVGRLELPGRHTTPGFPSPLPPQVGRELPGRHTTPGFPSPPSGLPSGLKRLPGQGVTHYGSPAATLARPADPARSLFGGRAPSVRRQPMMSQFARPRSR